MKPGISSSLDRHVYIMSKYLKVFQCVSEKKREASAKCARRQNHTHTYTRSCLGELSFLLLKIVRACNMLGIVESNRQQVYAIHTTIFTCPISNVWMPASARVRVCECVCSYFISFIYCHMSVWNLSFGLKVRMKRDICRRAKRYIPM